MGLDDVTFANTMTFYHLYEEAMANLVPKNAKDAKVKALAATIKKVQATEIARMSGWLVGGGIPAPVVQNGVIIGHTMATMGGQTKAMVTKPEIAALGKAKGQGFDRMWLTLMIRQHEGAAVTAKAELAKGLNAEAKQVAQTIVDRQAPEITTMKSIIAGIAG